MPPSRGWSWGKKGDGGEWGAVQGSNAGIRSKEIWRWRLVERAGLFVFSLRLHCGLKHITPAARPRNWFLPRTGPRSSKGPPWNDPRVARKSWERLCDWKCVCLGIYFSLCMCVWCRGNGIDIWCNVLLSKLALDGLLIDLDPCRCLWSGTGVAAACVNVGRGSRWTENFKLIPF